MTTTDAITEFRHAIEAAGLIPPDDIIADGRLHRFASNGEPRDDAGYYVLFADEILAGMFGCWRADYQENWCSRRRNFTPIEQRDHRQRIEAAKLEAAEERRVRQAMAQQHAADFWSSASEGIDHPYLQRKRISGRGSRVRHPMLLVPLHDETRALVNLQMINPDGEKRFLPGGKVRGCSCTLQGHPLRHLVCEGFATGAALWEATGDTVHIAFNAGNLTTVAVQVRSAHPAAAITIAADDDHITQGNPGTTKGIEAAIACNGQLAVPLFGPGRRDKATDFNDLFTDEGPEAVLASLRAANPPTRPPSAGSVGSAPGASAEEWPDPAPLPHTLPPVAAFHEDLLPDALRPWIMDIAERMQCPPDFPAAGAIVVLSSLVGARVRIQPKEHDDWKVTPNLWGLVVGLPGVMKSPALSEVMRPLERLEDRSRMEWQVKHAAWEMDQKQAALLSDVNEKKARKLLQGSSEANVTDLLMPVEILAEPHMPRFIVNDTSVEALGEVLEQNPWGILAHRDEIYGLLKSMDKEGQEGARAFYLQAFDGDKPYTVDRIGRGLNRRIACVCVSMLGGIQPGRIAEYVRSAVSGGGGDDGLIQRFQLAVWPDISRTFKNVDRRVNEGARDRAFAVYQRLSNLPEPGECGPTLLRFSPDAQQAFTEWRQHLEERLRTDDLHPVLQAHLSKYRKLVPALALIFELVDNAGAESVSAASLLRALRWADYLETHAHRLYSAASTPQMTGADALLARLRKGSVGPEFVLRDIYVKGWKHLAEPEAVRKAAATLVDFGWLKRVIRATKGRPAETYAAHPGISGVQA
jgi:putative DNA primase/helicase